MLLCRRRALGTVVYKSEAPCSVNKSYIFTFFVHVGGEPMLPQWYTKSEAPCSVNKSYIFTFFVHVGGEPMLPQWYTKSEVIWYKAFSKEHACRDPPPHQGGRSQC